LSEAPPGRAGLPSAAVIDTARARRAVDRAARSYADAARLELEVGMRMLERLDYIRLEPRWIVDAGSGPAREAAGLVKRFRDARVLALDVSQPMLHLAAPSGWAHRLAAAFGRGGTVAVCADMAALPLASGSVQLLWSNMALHWLSSPGKALAEFHRVLAPGGLLMFSTLGPDTLRELRSAFASVDEHAHVNTFIDMHDLGDVLAASGFGAPVMDAERITLTYTDARGLFNDLRRSGQNNSLGGRPRTLYGPGRWRRMLDALHAQMHEGRLPATAEVVYGHAWREAPKVQTRTSEGHAVISLDSFAKSPGSRK